MPRSALARIAVGNARRSWESGEIGQAIPLSAVAVTAVVDSSARMLAADLYVSRYIEYASSGQYDEAYRACATAARLLGQYDLEVEVSYNCPGLQTKALVYPQ